MWICNFVHIIGDWDEFRSEAVQIPPDGDGVQERMFVLCRSECLNGEGGKVREMGDCMFEFP